MYDNFDYLEIAKHASVITDQRSRPQQFKLKFPINASRSHEQFGDAAALKFVESNLEKSKLK
jgi:hypothetical protein